MVQRRRSARPRTRPRPACRRDNAADLSGVEHQLRQINSQISSLQQPYEDALAALRNDLAEVGRALHDAMPRQAIEALEADVRTLAERLDRTKQAGADGTTLGTLEHGLAEVRDALRALTPAESLVGFEEAVRHLSHKIDQIAVASQGPADPPRSISSSRRSYRCAASSPTSPPTARWRSSRPRCTRSPASSSAPPPTAAPKRSPSSKRGSLR